MTTDAEIESFIRSFEDGTLPRSEWTHGTHLVMALWYSVRHPGTRRPGSSGTASGGTTPPGQPDRVS